jgi:hypothetical protein
MDYHMCDEAFLLFSHLSMAQQEGIADTQDIQQELYLAASVT